MKDVKAHTSNQRLKPKPAWKDVRRRPLGPLASGQIFANAKLKLQKQEQSMNLKIMAKVSDTSKRWNFVLFEERFCSYFDACKQ